MERDELLERLLELKGKETLSATDWVLINQALADPALRNDLETMALLDTIEDKARMQSSNDAASLKLQAKLDRLDTPAKPLPWWNVLTKPRKAWGLPVVLAQLALLAVYFNFGAQQLVPQDSVEVYRSGGQFDPCEAVKVKFRPEVTIEEITELLKKASLSIVGGPLNGNEYVVLIGPYTQPVLVEMFRGLGTVEAGVCKK